MLTMATGPKTEASRIQCRASGSVPVTGLTDQHVGRGILACMVDMILSKKCIIMYISFVILVVD